MLKMQPRALIEPFGWTVATRIPSRTRPFGDGAGGRGSFGFRLTGLGRGGVALGVASHAVSYTHLTLPTIA